MAAMRARRPSRAVPLHIKRRRAAAAAYDSMPRLARIKLSGLSSDEAQLSAKSVGLALTSLVLFVGVAIAGASWLGSSLFDAREALARSADGAAAHAGFDVSDIEIAAMPDAPAVPAARASEVRALIVPEGRASILSLNPGGVKARVESLDWVAAARVRRLWPSTLRVEVRRRQEYAVWENEGQVSVIDVNGERLLAERAADHTDLPRVVGPGAGPAAEPLLIALEGLPEVRARLAEIVRIGDRRWNLELKSGATVALPEEGATQALARLEALQAEYALLDRPLTRLDMRTPGRLAVRINPVLAGGPHPLPGGA